VYKIQHTSEFEPGMCQHHTGHGIHIVIFVATAVCFNTVQLKLVCY